MNSFKTDSLQPEVDAPHPMIAASYWSANRWSESVLAAGKQTGEMASK